MASKETLKTLYTRIKFLTGLTQQEIAAKLGYERTYLSSVINNKKENETVRQLMELTFANELGLSFVQFNKDKDYKGKTTLAELAADVHGNLLAINAHLKVLTLKVAELENSITKKGFAEISLEMEKMTQQEIKRAFEKLRTG